MINKELLNAVITEHADTQEALANAMNMPLLQLVSRINGETEFHVSEAAFIRDRYKLSNDDVRNIFFVN